MKLTKRMKIFLTHQTVDFVVGRVEFGPFTGEISREERTKANGCKSLSCSFSLSSPAPLSRSPSHFQTQTYTNHTIQNSYPPLSSSKSLTGKSIVWMTWMKPGHKSREVGGKQTLPWFKPPERIILGLNSFHAISTWCASLFQIPIDVEKHIQMFNTKWGN